MTCSRELTTFSFNDFLIGPLLLGGSLLSGGGGTVFTGVRYEGGKKSTLLSGSRYFRKSRGAGVGGGAEGVTFGIIHEKENVKAEPPDWRGARALPTRRSGVYLTDWATG